MIVCVANTSPEKVKRLLEKKGIDFSMWKPGVNCNSDSTYGFFNYDDLRASGVRTTPVFFNIVSAFNHIEYNYPIYRMDYKELPTGLVFFQEPRVKELIKALGGKFSLKNLDSVSFRPAKVGSYEGSELAGRWNNFILTLPSCVAETFMVCFISCVRRNDKEYFHKFVVDNRLVGTGNKAAYAELDAIIRCMWPVMHACATKAENMDPLKKKFLKKNPMLDTSLSRFLFWNRSYKGKKLSDYMDKEDNVALGIKE